jgi:diguanylate cyclase (GGDEF)-like protein
MNPPAGDTGLNTFDLAARLRAASAGLRRRLERREALVDMVRAVNTTVEPGGVAELVIERVAAWLPGPAWAVVVADGAGRPNVLASRGAAPESVPASLLGSVSMWVVEHGTVFTTRNLRKDGRIADDLEASVFAFPLRSRGRQIGAIVGYGSGTSSREPGLPPAIQSAIAVLLEPVAGALDSALQLKRSEELSVTDDLTALYNSRYLNLVLRRETKRASRSGRPLSLLFIDLDGFKAVNDTHGHLCGSRTLVEAAGVIRANARETDVVARFGGDEFALVLPDTGPEGARAVGERIRERLAAHPFLAADGLNVRLTASIGVATLPDAATTPDELMQAADIAMYFVKDQGKNGVHAAPPDRQEQERKALDGVPGNG